MKSFTMNMLIELTFTVLKSFDEKGFIKKKRKKRVDYFCPYVASISADTPHRQIQETVTGSHFQGESS